MWSLLAEDQAVRDALVLSAAVWEPKRAHEQLGEIREAIAALLGRLKLSAWESPSERLRRAGINVVLN